MIYLQGTEQVQNASHRINEASMRMKETAHRIESAAVGMDAALDRFFYRMDELVNTLVQEMKSIQEAKHERAQEYFDDGTC